MNSEFTVGISLSPTSRLCFVTSGHCGTIINELQAPLAFSLKSPKTARGE